VRIKLITISGTEIEILEFITKYIDCPSPDGCPENTDINSCDECVLKYDKTFVYVINN